MGSCKRRWNNWGYNPVEFNSLSRWYSSDGAPYTAINEFKQLVDEIHKNGLNINLDVVYNHVYVASTFSLNILVPGYGAQGGKGKDLAHFFNEDGLGAIINSSRGIIAAYQQEAYAKFGAENFGDASRAAVEAMVLDISTALNQAK